MDMSDPDAYMNPQQAEALADKIGSCYMMNSASRVQTMTKKLS